MCGATAVMTIPATEIVGLSPRVRGNQVDAPLGGPRERPIPACAGQPTTATQVIGLLTAYPRVCGATSEGQRNIALGKGLSPRVRGNHEPATEGQSR